MKKTFTIAGFIAAISWCLAAAQVHEAEETEPFPVEKRPFSVWMDVKLGESQKIFAAMAQADFPAVIESTNTLKRLNRLERFVRSKLPEYRTQLRAFEFGIDEMRTQAEAENLEGVVLGFQQMTLSCVNCHKQIRAPMVRELQKQPTGDQE